MALPPPSTPPHRFLRTLLLNATLGLGCLLLAACGGGGSSTLVAAPPEGVVLNGVVEDGPIADALVFLVHKGSEEILYNCGPLENERCETTSEIARACGPRGTELCETRSDSQGGFSLTLGPGLVPANYFVVANGGRDTLTGVDFTSLELRAPLELAESTEAVVVSPITTLLAGLLDAGLDLPTSQAQLRTWLNLPADQDLALRPSVDLHLQHRSLLLTKLATELQQTGASNPFRRLRDQVTQPGILFSDPHRLDQSTLQQLGLDPAATTRTILLAERLAAAPPASWNHLFQQEELVQALSLAAAAMLVENTGFDPGHPDLQANLRALADQVILAAEPGGIPLGGLAPQRVARYVLLSYNLRSVEALRLPPETFVAALRLTDGTALNADPLIGELARSRTFYHVATPLLAEERPGDDNGRRLYYYYHSDRSHLYQAERLLATVFDDSLSDAVLLAILAGKVEAGLLEEGRAILETQIFGSENRGHGYRTLARTLLSLGRREEALGALHQARALYNRVIAAKGNASAANSDTANLQGLAADFRKAGDLAGAQAVLADLEAVARDLTSLTAYGRLVVGTWQVADSLIDQKDLPAAAPVLESLHQFASNTPPNPSGTTFTLRSRVFNLIETARRFADSGQFVRALAVADEIDNLRLRDGYSNLTAAETWVWIPTLVTVRYQAGDEAGALRLALSIPSSYRDAAGALKSGEAQQLSAFKQVATFDAMHGRLEQAFTRVNSFFPKAEDRVDVLTYFAANKGVPYIGLGLIQQGRHNEAREALALAQTALAAVVASTDQNRYTLLIQRGWVKLADLYAMTGDMTTAASLLARGETVLPSIAAAQHHVNTLRDLALGYQQLGLGSEAVRLLTAAETRIATTAASLTPEAVASLYDTLILAWQKLGRQDRVLQALETARPWVRRIHDPTIAYTGTANDDQAGKEVDALLKQARQYLTAGSPGTSRQLLLEAQAVAEGIFVATTRLGKYIHGSRTHIIGVWAQAGEFDRALELAQGLPFASNRNQAIQYLANRYASRDDFPDHWVATIDKDGDGRPDFFNPLATAADILASGLLLDDDSDGDGIADTDDWRPLFRDF